MKKTKCFISIINNLPKVCMVCKKSKNAVIQFEDLKVVCVECCKKQVGTVLEKWLEMIHNNFFKNGKHK